MFLLCRGMSNAHVPVAHGCLSLSSPSPAVGHNGRRKLSFNPCWRSGILGVYRGIGQNIQHGRVGACRGA